MAAGMLGRHFGEPETSPEASDGCSGEPETSPGASDGCFGESETSPGASDGEALKAGRAITLSGIGICDNVYAAIGATICGNDDLLVFGG